MFKFNFHNNEGENDEPDEVSAAPPPVPVESDSNITAYESVEKQKDSLHVTLASKYVHSRVKVGEIGLWHAKLCEVELAMKEQLPESTEFSAHLAEAENSDLLKGVYEGGLKLWECTIDLLKYLNRTNVSFSSHNVLDLGCGCGLLGIYALSKGAQVDFQDYNTEVLDYLTIPNVILNECQSPSKFYSGDWQSFREKLTQKGIKYDIILTSETIYEASNYPKLVETLETLLKPTGVTFLAAKTHYFGVGGGTRQFEMFLAKNSTLVSEIVWKADSGLQREILSIRFKL